MSNYINFDKIPQRLEDIEDLYSILYNSEKNVGLLLPTNIKSSQLGIKTSLCQFINTWYRYTNDQASLHTYVNNEKDIELQITNLCDQFHGLVAIGMAMSKRKIVNKTKTFEFTQKAKKILTERLKKMQGVERDGRFIFDEKLGRPLMLVCFDHLAIDELKFLHWLYEFDFKERAYSVRNVRYFRNLFLRISQSIWIQRISETKKIESLKITVGGILEELFKNTHDWARTGFGANEDVFFETNMRGIFTEVHSGSKTHFQEICKGSPPLETYFNHPIFFQNTKNEAKSSFLEISILDSGSGFSQKKSKEKLTKDKSLNKEFDDIIDCLAKYESSATSIESRLRGRGLKEVADLCGKVGFFKIRTSRLCVYRDFVLNPYNPSGIMSSEYIEEIKTIKSYIKDWINCNETLTEFHFAEGSLITIYYPLDTDITDADSDQLKLQF